MVPFVVPFLRKTNQTQSDKQFLNGTFFFPTIAAMFAKRPFCGKIVDFCNEVLH